MSRATLMRLAIAAAAAAATTAGPAAAAVISIAARDTAGLVAAIDHANRDPGEDVIELAARSLYVVERTAERGRALALPSIRSPIRILGNGAEIRAYTRQPLLLLEVAADGALRLEHLTLAEGGGGAIVNRGELTLWRVAVVDNSAPGSDAIVTNHGTLRARRCEIAHNELPGAPRDAGIVLNLGTLELAECTLAGNRVFQRHAGRIAASAILNLGIARLRQVSVLDNAADAVDPARSGPLIALGRGRFIEVGTRIEGSASGFDASRYLAD